MAFGNSRYSSSPQGLFWLASVVFPIAGCFLVLLVYVSFSGPGEISRAKSWEVDEALVIEWMTKSAEAEEAFRREYAVTPDHPQVYDNLESAIGYQRKLKALDLDDTFGSVTRLAMLLHLLEDTKGNALYAIIKRNGDRAADLVARGDAISAMPLLEESLEYQQWINNNLRESPYVDVGEVARLKQWLASLQTIDAVAEVEGMVLSAKKAYSVADWNEAESLFDRALSIQESINLNMPESPHVRWRLVQELKDYKLRIEAGRMNQRIEELLSSSGERNETDRLRMAMNLQDLLNNKYESTEFADPDRVERLREAIASDRSRASGTLLQQLKIELNRHLQDRYWALAHKTLLELEDSVNRFVEAFSLSLLPEPELRERVDWMISIEPKLEMISNSVENRLVRPPELSMRILSTEVDQALYEHIMGTNPSRWIDPNLPVDSVSFYDAELFCKRLGWLMGRDVHIPQVDWLDFLSEVDLEGNTFWLSHNSGFRSKPIGNSDPIMGFYDLFGNLEEWIVDASGNEVAGLFGGCGADSPSKLRNDPINQVAANFRSRWTGFRFCILDSPLNSPN